MAIRIGTDADETLNTNVSSPADDFVWGAGGVDFIQTFDLDDEGHGGLGNDSVLGGSGDDWLSGYRSDTILFSLYLPAVQFEADVAVNNCIGPDGDITFGGDDFIAGGVGNDHIYGGGGNDSLYGSVAAKSRGSGVDLSATVREMAPSPVRLVPTFSYLTPTFATTRSPASRRDPTRSNLLTRCSPICGCAECGRAERCERIHHGCSGAIA